LPRLNNTNYLRNDKRYDVAYNYNQHHANKYTDHHSHKYHRNDDCDIICNFNRKHYHHFIGDVIGHVDAHDDGNINSYHFFHVDENHINNNDTNVNRDLNINHNCHYIRHNLAHVNCDDDHPRHALRRRI